MLHTFIARAQDKPGVLTRVASRHHAALRASLLSALALPLLLLGCKSAPAPTPTPANSSTASAPAATYPARPTVPPAPFKIFHHADSRFTLVTKDNASDDEIESLIWQLRDAARTRTYDKLKIPQKEVDAGAPTVWFHIYRGTKCAAEKYAAGPPPCGGSYHAAGDYTFDSHKNPAWDHGILLHGEDHEISLWNPDAPYAASTPQTSNPK